MYEFVGNTLVPSEVIDVDICVNEAYPNLRVGYMPTENRSADQLETHPFAVVDQFGGFVIKPLTVAEAKSAPFVLKWLYDNDSARHDEKDLWNDFLKHGAQIRAAKQEAAKEKTREKLDVVATIAASPLHTFRHNGQKIGVDNHRPHLGLWDEEN